MGTIKEATTLAQNPDFRSLTTTVYLTSSDDTGLFLLCQLLVFFPIFPWRKDMLQFLSVVIIISSLA